MLSWTTGKFRLSNGQTTHTNVVVKPGCASIPVLIVDLDDERHVVEVVRLYGSRSRSVSEKIGSIGELEEWLQKNNPEQLPVALCLPDTNGCKSFIAVTAYSDEPRVFLSGSIRDMEHLLGIGADERCDAYAVNTGSLRARLTAIREKTSQSRKRSIRYADITIDGASLTASAGGVDLVLTPAEFRLLRILVSNPNKVFTREQLLTATCGDVAEVSDRSVDAHIKNLRKKLRGSSRSRVQIRAVYGVGYKLE